MKLLFIAQKIFRVVMSCCCKGSNEKVIVPSTHSTVLNTDSTISSPENFNVRDPDVAICILPNIDLSREVCSSPIDVLHSSNLDGILNNCQATSTSDIPFDLSKSVFTLRPKAPRFISFHSSSNIADWEEFRVQIREDTREMLTKETQDILTSALFPPQQITVHQERSARYEAEISSLRSEVSMIQNSSSLPSQSSISGDGFEVHNDISLVPVSRNSIPDVCLDNTSRSTACHPLFHKICIQRKTM